MTTVTHNIDVRARSSGFRTIKRKIDEVGEAANRSTRGIFLLQRSLFVLGGAGALRALATQADLLTNVENRLKLTTTSTRNLEEVQTRLFQVARDSRTSFESVAEIYNRTALSVRDLGISQQETARFTESLAKASILSGASTREANAALIQLSQGLASNRLSGDELRSVLEQLPFVADVIAKQLGVTRGELRQFGRDGKISAEVVLEAFRNAKEEIDRLFANTQPTISQALSKANTNWLEFLDNLEDTYQISTKVANTIIFLSKNIDILVKSVIAVAAAFAASFGIKTIQSISNFVLQLRAGSVESARLLEVENLQAAATVRRTQAAVASNAALQAELQQRLALLGIQKAQLQQTVLDTQFTVANGRARNIATGQFVSLTAAKENLTRVTQQLSIVEGVEATTAGRLATARAAQTGATTTAAAANARLAAAQAASAGTTAKLTRTFPLLAGGIGLAARAMASLAALIAANPIGVAVVSVVAAIAAFSRWGNKIKVTSDGVVGLKDAVVAAFQLMMKKIAPFADFLRTSIGGAVTATLSAFAAFGDGVLKVLNFVSEVVYDTFTFFPRLAVATIAGIVAAFQSLPDGAAGSMAILANIVISGFESLANGAIKALNSIIDGLNKLLSFVGADKAAELFGFSGQIGNIDPLELNRFKSEYEGAGKVAADAFGDAFTDSFENTNLQNTVQTIGSALEPIGKTITDKARQNIDMAAEDALMAMQVVGATAAAASGGGGGEGGGGGTTSADFASIISKMEQEISLLQLSSSERERSNEILKIEKQLKRGLTEAERSLADETIRSLEAAKTQADILESIKGPREDIINQQKALNALLEQGRIDLDDYNNSMNDMKIAAADASGTLAGGFISSIQKAIMSTQELGSALGDAVVNGADRAADAIVEFAETGKLNFGELTRSIVADMLKIISKQLILKGLGFVFGGIGGIGIGGLLPFSTGGSILPSGPGSTDSQIVSFKKRPDERVDILTPGQQDAQKMNSRSSKESSTVNQTMIMNITTQDANSFKQSEAQIANRIRLMAQRGVRGA